MKNYFNYDYASYCVSDTDSDDAAGGISAADRRRRAGGGPIVPPPSVTKVYNSTDVMPIYAGSCTNEERTYPRSGLKRFLSTTHWQEPDLGQTPVPMILFTPIYVNGPGVYRTVLTLGLSDKWKPGQQLRIDRYINDVFHSYSVKSNGTEPAWLAPYALEVNYTETRTTSDIVYIKWVFTPNTLNGRKYEINKLSVRWPDGYDWVQESVASYYQRNVDGGPDPTVLNSGWKMPITRCLYDIPITLVSEQGFIPPVALFQSVLHEDADNEAIERSGEIFSGTSVATYYPVYGSNMQHLNTKCIRVANKANCKMLFNAPSNLNNTLISFFLIKKL